MQLEELNLPTLNCKIPQYFQKILAHELTLKRPSHELKKTNYKAKEEELLEDYKQAFKSLKNENEENME